METPEQVIAKIRSAPDDASALKVWKECGCEIGDGPSEEAPKGEAPDRGPSAKWDILMSKHMGAKKEMPADGG